MILWSGNWSIKSKFITLSSLLNSFISVFLRRGTCTIHVEATSGNAMPGFPVIRLEWEVVWVVRIILTALPQVYLLMILSRRRVIPSKTVKYKKLIFNISFITFYFRISRYYQLRSNNMFLWFIIFYNRRGRNLFHLLLLILSNKENIGQKLNRNINYKKLICWWIINIAYCEIQQTLVQN